MNIKKQLAKFDLKRVNKDPDSTYLLFTNFLSAKDKEIPINSFQLSTAEELIKKYRADYIIHGDTFKSQIAIHLLALQLQKPIIIIPPTQIRGRKWLNKEFGCFNCLVTTETPMRTNLMFFYCDRIIIFAQEKKKIFVNRSTEGRALINRAVLTGKPVDIIGKSILIENDRNLLKEIVNEK